MIKYHKPLYSTAVIISHGSADQVVPYTSIGEYAVSIDQILDYWIKFNGTNVTPKINTFNNDTTKLEPSAYSKKNNFKYDTAKIEHYSYR